MARKLPALVVAIGAFILMILIDNNLVQGDTLWFKTTPKTTTSRKPLRIRSARNSYQWKQQYLYGMSGASSNQMMSWSSWSQCSYGFQTKYLSGCNLYAGTGCMQRRRCDTNTNSRTKLVSTWSTWSNCDQGYKTRTGPCQYSGGCIERISCRDNENQWSTWSSVSSQWGSWSRCANNYKKRERSCDTPQSRRVCQETIYCDEETTWTSWSIPQPSEPRNLFTTSSPPSEWGRWSNCENGVRTRRRRCGYGESPNLCAQTKRCDTNPEIWSSWTPPSTPTWGRWSECSNGISMRTKPCHNERNKNACTQRKACYTTPRQQWTSWSTPPSTWQSWTECVNGYRKRERDCDARYNRDTCQEMVRCHATPEIWSSWTSPYPPSEWGRWSTCMNYVRTRRRQCSYNENQNACIQTERCDMTPEARDLRTTASPYPWGSWSSCINGEKTRRRECRYGENLNSCFETDSCHVIDPWSSWTSTEYPSTWGPWSACYYGTKTRKRSCGNSANDDDCLEQVRCIESTAPSDSWGQWSACMNGYKTRTFQCMGNSKSSQCNRRQRLNCLYSSNYKDHHMG